MSEQGEVQLHGNLPVTPEGQAVWENTGHQPFIDNKSLLLRMAEITGSWTPPATTALRLE